MSIGVLSPQVKRQQREIAHLTPFTAEIKYEWICTSAPPIYLQCVDSDNLIITLPYFYRWMHVQVCLHNFKIIHPIVHLTTKVEWTNDRQTQQNFYNTNIATCFSLRLEVKTSSYIDNIKLLSCSTVLCLFILHCTYTHYTVHCFCIQNGLMTNIRG